MHSFKALILTVVLLMAVQAKCASPDLLFSRAEMAPDDVWLYVHVEDMQTLRKSLENLPIAGWAGNFLAGGQFIKTWGYMAGLAGVNNAGLIDMIVGDQLTLLVRGSGKELQWLLMTPVDDQRAATIYKKLRVKVRTTRAGVSMSFVPDHQLLIARTPDGLMLICHLSEQKLLYDVLNRSDPDHELRTLSGLPALKSARQLSQGQAGVYINHDEPLGGWSVATFRFNERHLHIQHRARFARDAFVRPITEMEIDPSIIENFRDGMMVATIEPTDIGKSPVELFIEQNILSGLSLLGPEIQENIGDYRILCLGDVEGRMQHHKADMRLPTASMCVKVKDGDIAERQIDQHFFSLSRHLNTLGQGAFLIEVPNRRTFIPGDPRQIDLDSLTDLLGQGMPFLSNVDLCYQVADTPNGSFLIVASHPEALQETLKALMKKCSATLPTRRWASVGVANGVRIGQNIESLGEQAIALAEPGKARELRSALKLMSTFAFGIEDMMWKLTRSCKNEMQIEVDIEFTAPLSAEEK